MPRWSGNTDTLPLDPSLGVGADPPEPYQRGIDSTLTLPAHAEDIPTPATFTTAQAKKNRPTFRLHPPRFINIGSSTEGTGVYANSFMVTSSAARVPTASIDTANSHARPAVQT